MGNIVHGCICCDQDMTCVCRNAQVLELFDNTQSAGIRVVGEEKVLFVMLIEPPDEFLPSRQQGITPIYNAVKVD